MRIAFLFAPAQILPGVNRLAPPHFVAWLHPVSGALVELRPVTPKSFQQTHGADEMIGEFRLPPDTTAEDYLAQRRQMFDLYPSLVAAWSGNLPPENVGLQAPAREFLRLFGILSEPPLIAYYHALGSRFFDWVRKAVKA